MVICQTFDEQELPGKPRIRTSQNRGTALRRSRASSRCRDILPQRPGDFCIHSDGDPSSSPIFSLLRFRRAFKKEIETLLVASHFSGGDERGCKAPEPDNKTRDEAHILSARDTRDSCQELLELEWQAEDATYSQKAKTWSWPAHSRPANGFLRRYRRVPPGRGQHDAAFL